MRAALGGLLRLGRPGASAANRLFAEGCGALNSFEAVVDFFDRNHAQISSGYALGAVLGRLTRLAPPCAPAGFLPQLTRQVLVYGDARSVRALGRLLRVLRPRDDALLSQLLSLPEYNLSRTKHLLVKCLLVRYCFQECTALGRAVEEAEKLSRDFCSGALHHAPPYNVPLAALIAASPDVFRLDEPAVLALLSAAPLRSLDGPALLEYLQALEAFSRVFPSVEAALAPPLEELSLAATSGLSASGLVRLLGMLGRFAPARQAEALGLLEARLAEAERLELSEAEFLQLLTHLSAQRCITPELYSQLYTHFLDKLETLRPDTLTRALLAHAHIIRQMHANINARLPATPDLLRRKNSVKSLNEKLVERAFTAVGKGLDRLAPEDLSRLLKAVAVSGYKRRSMFFVLREVVLELFWRLETRRAERPELWERVAAQVAKDIALMRLDEKKRSELFRLAGVEPMRAEDG